MNRWWLAVPAAMGVLWLSPIQHALKLRGVLFMGISSLAFAWFRFLYRRYLEPLRAPPRWRPWIRLTHIVYGLLAMMGPLSLPLLGLKYGSWVGFAMMVSFGSTIYSLFCVLVTEVVFFILRPEWNATTIARWKTGMIIGLVITFCSLAMVEAAADPYIRDITVTLPKLPHSADGFTIIQLSDIHTGPSVGRKFVEWMVKRVNELEPDLIVITGDLVDGSIGLLESDVTPITQMRSPHGIYFVTGNHEYYHGDVAAWLHKLEGWGIRVLHNEMVTINETRGGRHEAIFDLAGVDDFQSGAFHGEVEGRFGDQHGPNLDKALRGRNLEHELILLAHQPKQIAGAHAAGVGLQLSGHTHGGQLWPFHYMVGLGNPYLEGFHQHEGSTYIHVSRGTGTWGPPMRFLAPAEITRITLHSQNPLKAQ